MHLLIAKVSFKFVNPFACYVPERVEVPNKSTQLPIVNKRGRSIYDHKVGLFIASNRRLSFLDSKCRSTYGWQHIVGKYWLLPGG